MSKRKKHGFWWWLLIGWWMYPSLGCFYIIKGIYFDLPVFIIRTIAKLIARIKSPARANTAPQTSTPAKKEPYVYVTAGGKKYHYDIMCPGIRNAKEIKMDLSKARAAGYKACDKCCFEYLHRQD